MAAFEQLANLLMIAERSSQKGAVMIDFFRQSEAPAGGDGLAPRTGEAPPVGRVVAENGRICWVISKGDDAYLSDILALDTGIERDAFERVFESARAAGIPFCEKLSQSGLVDPAVIRLTLRSQIGAALAELANLLSQEEIAYSITTIPSTRYSENFTFEALGLLQVANLHSEDLRNELGMLPKAFARVAPKLQAAICFRETEASDIPLVPVSFWARRSLSMSEAIELSLEGIASIQPGDLFVAEISPFTLIAPEESECWVCAYTAPHLCLFQVDTQAQYLGVLSNLLADRRNTLLRSREDAKQRATSDP
jgi:hypothetical protein